MRVLINGLAALKPKTGVGHHVAELHTALAQIHPEMALTLYPGQQLSRWITAANRPKAQAAATAPASGMKSQVKKWLRSSAKSLGKLASNIHFRSYTRTFGFDLYHEPNFLPFPCHLPTIVTVHDLSVLKFPDWHPADRVRYHHRHFLRGLSRAEHIIVVSEAVRRELIDELGCPPTRVTAVYNGIGPQFMPQSEETIAQVRKELNLPSSYFLCVGTIEPRKNLNTVIRAFADLPLKLREEVPLILAGPWGWRAESERDLFEKVGKPAGVRHLGYTRSDQLPALYAGARALLYPSHYEGFGMPPTEMLACGGAVIASTADSLQEVLGNCAEFVPAEDLTGWRDAMRRAIEQPDFRKADRARGREHVARYSWAAAAERTFQVYRYVLGIRQAELTGSTSSRTAA